MIVRSVEMPLIDRPSYTSSPTRVSVVFQAIQKRFRALLIRFAREGKCIDKLIGVDIDLFIVRELRTIIFCISLRCDRLMNINIVNVALNEGE